MPEATVWHANIYQIYNSNSEIGLAFKTQTQNK